MYFNGFFARNYYTDTYWGLSGDTPQDVIIGAYKGLYLGIYAKLYERE
jgi:hypothetical protein